MVNRCRVCPLEMSYTFLFLLSRQCALYRPCWNSSACLNIAPGYQCLACPPGYTGTYEDALAWNDTRRVFERHNQVHAALQFQTCEDVDECADNNGGCDIHSKCINTVVSMLQKWK